MRAGRPHESSEAAACSALAGDVTALNLTPLAACPSRFLRGDEAPGEASSGARAPLVGRQTLCHSGVAWTGFPAKNRGALAGVFGNFGHVGAWAAQVSRGALSIMEAFLSSGPPPNVTAVLLERLLKSSRHGLSPSRPRWTTTKNSRIISVSVVFLIVATLRALQDLLVHTQCDVGHGFVSVCSPWDRTPVRTLQRPLLVNWSAISVPLK
jgi:hypothetical protein